MPCKDIEEGRAYARKYYWNHRECRIKYKRENREHGNEIQRKWYYSNSDRIGEYRNSLEYKTNRNLQRKRQRRIDINYKILGNLRGRLHDAITRGIKSAGTLELLGCSVNFLRKYLENKFKEGMDWNNYGLYGWHIDHIIPCSGFDLTQSKEQRECFHYSNLQPLWARENLMKGKQEEELK